MKVHLKGCEMGTFNFASMLGLSEEDETDLNKGKICTCKEIEEQMKRMYPSEFNKERQELVCRIYNYRCVLCGTGHGLHGQRGLVVHHIDYNKHNSSLTNLVPLCKHCHDEIPQDSESAMLHILRLPVVVKMHKMLKL